MKEEKMMILSMLEEGKITSEEAIKLLEALEENENFIDYEEPTDNMPNTDKTRKKLLEIEKNIKEQGKRVESISTDLGNKITNLVNSIIDKSSSFNLGASYEILNTKLEEDLTDIENPIIELESINGNIDVRKWNKDKLSLDITVKFRNKDYDKDDEFYNFYEEGNVFRFVPINKDNIMISLDVNLPDKYYEKINLKTTNGRIQIINFELDSISCNTSNGSISTMDITSKNMDLCTSNGKINLSNITSPIINASSTNSRITLKDIQSKNIVVSTFNGRITFQNISSNNISGTTSNSSIELYSANSNKINLNTSNGRIICRDIYSENINEIDLSTSNSSIDIELKDLNKPGYFDLETSIGGISLEIPDLIYNVNRQVKLGTRKIIAHSVQFSEEKEHFKLKASTSNGSINIR